MTLRIGASPYIYYYFVHKNKVYRGSTKTDNPKEAKKAAICFRHQFATEMTARGVPLKALGEQMGHKSLRMGDSTYTHLMREHHAIIAERIGMDNNGHKQAEVILRGSKMTGFLTGDFDKGMTDEEFEELRALIIKSYQKI